MSDHTLGLAKDRMKEVYKPGVQSDITVGFYDQWVKDDLYEKDLNSGWYAGPRIAAQALADFFPSSERDKSKILDVAAGTGVDALDPSEGMLQKAQKKNIYNNLICCFLDDKKLPVLEDTYDCAVTAGGMGEGHIPYVGLDQLIRVVVPGGLVCITMREEYLNHSQYKDKLEPHMEKLVREKAWVLVSKTVVPKYCMDHNGLVYQFKVLDGKYSRKAGV